jgi:hypothetical protein
MPAGGRSPPRPHGIPGQEPWRQLWRISSRSSVAGVRRIGWVAVMSSKTEPAIVYTLLLSRASKLAGLPPSLVEFPSARSTWGTALPGKAPWARSPETVRGVIN